MEGTLSKAVYVTVLLGAIHSTHSTAIEVPESLWPPITCHKWYDKTYDGLRNANAACQKGTSVQVEKLKTVDDGYNLVVDRKACILFELNLVKLQHSENGQNFFSYQTEEKFLHKSLSHLFGDSPSNKGNHTEAEKKERGEFVKKLGSNGGTCGQEHLKEETGNSMNWGNFYNCIERIWGC